MTSKKRRQRGSRTHGGGSHKNRRGAGHRGGRGDAGRDKHEQQLHGPLGKHGFKRPEDASEEVLTVNVGELDEDVLLYMAEDLATASDAGYEIDARDVVEDGHEADVVKVLGGGQVHNVLSVTADAFSESARDLIESAGGEVHLTERGRRRAEERADERTETDTPDEAES